MKFYGMIKDIFWIVAAMMLLGFGVMSFYTTLNPRDSTITLNVVGINKTTATNFNSTPRCCYPTECAQSENNPDKCTCIYPLACGTLEEFGLSEEQIKQLEEKGGE